MPVPFLVIPALPFLRAIFFVLPYYEVFLPFLHLLLKQKVLVLFRQSSPAEAFLVPPSLRLKSKSSFPYPKGFLGFHSFVDSNCLLVALLPPVVAVVVRGGGASRKVSLQNLFLHLKPAKMNLPHLPCCPD